MGFLREIEKRILIHDGSKGYLLQRMGLKGGSGEFWNLTNQDAVRGSPTGHILRLVRMCPNQHFPGQPDPPGKIRTRR